nr:uncharacterized protein LOC109765559 isoform X8 [Aegilops tauschii subsp. strangulata]XP_045090849.1 uncharacterized protein LOC109765559 isoform X8 [Aegilops tauschii subsp. strangulata]
MLEPSSLSCYGPSGARGGVVLLQSSGQQELLQESYAPSLPSSKRSRSSDKSNTARQRVWPSLRYTHSYLPSPALRPTLPNLTKLCYTYIMRERSRCVHRNTQANQMTRCLEQANHSQLHSLVLCCIKAV